MPKINGTGPMGQGPMTGRGMGPCGGGMNRRGRGCRQKFSFARFGRLFSSSKNQLQVLEDEEKILLEELEAIRTEKEALKDLK